MLVPGRKSLSCQRFQSSVSLIYSCVTPGQHAGGGRCSRGHFRVSLQSLSLVTLSSITLQDSLHNSLNACRLDGAR